MQRRRQARKRGTLYAILCLLRIDAQGGETMPGAGLPLWSWLLLSLIGFAVTALLLVALWRVARALREQAERQRRP